jgi:hypothetical protein
MTTATITANDLRGQIAEIEEKQIKLTAERAEIAFAAVVEKDKKSATRVAEINEELTRLTNEAATIAAALKTALAREREADASEQARRKRADLEQAGAMLTEVEQLALQIDAAMKALHEATTAFERAWAKIRALSGAGPHKTAITVHLGRTFRVGLRGLPGIVADMVPPNERHTAADLNTGWSQQVRNLAAREIEPVQAKAATKAAAKVKEFLR